MERLTEEQRDLMVEMLSQTRDRVNGYKATLETPEAAKWVIAKFDTDTDECIWLCVNANSSGKPYVLGFCDETLVFNTRQEANAWGNAKDLRCHAEHYFGAIQVSEFLQGSISEAERVISQIHQRLGEDLALELLETQGT